MAKNISRRRFLAALGLGMAAARAAMGAAPPRKPNVILMMADDQGWGDAGYHGHPVLKTPNLDAMAAEGLRFERFYSGAPVCSPTRGSCLTGRHPHRYGVFYANEGHMREQELTLAEALRAHGYRTGHFGKWHLGTLTKKVKDSNRGGPDHVKEYSPPWDNGFDVCFSTEAKVPTWDPMTNPENGKPYGTQYWNERGEKVTENLEGDDSRIIMDRAVPFVRAAAQESTPFFAVVWFHAPHRPVVAGPKHLAMYPGEPEEQRHYYGCITALDEQVGRLRKELNALGVADNTMLWYCSDNGPEGRKGSAPGSAGPLRGRKRSLYEGGIRVPGLLVWPKRVPEPRTTHLPCSTSDLMPTVLSAAGIRHDGPQPVDGVSLMPLVRGDMETRSEPIAFESRNQLAVVADRYKLYSPDGGKTFELYDIPADPSESRDLADEMPGMVKTLRRVLNEWREGCKQSLDNKDYPNRKEGKAK